MKKKKITDQWFDSKYLASIAKYIDSIASNQAEIDGADLSGIIIGPDALLSELKSKSLYKARLTNTNLSYAKISGSMSNSKLVRVNLTGSLLDRCIMLECHIDSCDFSHAKLVVKMNDTVCESSNFSEAKIASGSAGLEYGGRRVRFINCNFTNTLFSKVEFRASKFLNCNFTGAKFINCDLRGVKVEGGVVPLVSQFEKMDAPPWAE